MKIYICHNPANTFTIPVMNRPTLKEISARTGLSIATISRAMSGSGLVRRETQEIIDKAVRELQNRGGQSNLIGLVIPDTRNPFFPMMYEGINDVADANDLTILQCSSNANATREEKIVRRLVDYGVDGLILISCGTVYPYLERIVRDRHVPIVFLDRDPGLAGIDLVTVENRDGMYQAAKYLITLGHRQILFLAGTKGASTTKERYDGFMQAIHDSDVDASGIIFENADYGNATAYHVVRSRIMDRGNVDFTAVCASNDEMALGAMRALAELGIDVPHDVSVIGYDDIPSAGKAGLTTVRQPLREMGKNAMYLLMQEMRDNSMPHQKMTLSANLILRDTGSPARR